MKNARRILSVIVFITLFIWGYSVLNDIFLRKSLDKPWDMSNKIGGYFNESDRYEIMFLGSSHSYCSFQPLVIYMELGAKSYILASQSQPLEATYYYMKEVLKRDKPKIIVLDILSAISSFEVDEAIVHSYTDYIPWSMNKIDMVLNAVPPIHRAHVFCPLMMYHGRWKELKEEDFIKRSSDYKDYLKGYVMLEGQSKEFLEHKNIPNLSDASDFETVKRFISSKIPIIVKMVDLCEKNEVQLMLVKTPISQKNYLNRNLGILNSLLEPYCQNVLDFNQYYDQIGLVREDFYDFWHLNVKGAEKFNRFFIDYIISQGIKFDNLDPDSTWIKDYNMYVEAIGNNRLDN